MRTLYGQVIAIILCLGWGALGGYAEISVPAQGDVMTEEYASYFFYDNGYAGYTLLGAEQLAVDHVDRKSGAQSVVYSSDWDTYDFNAKVGVYSGGVSTPWVLDDSYSVFMWLKLQGPAAQSFWLYVVDAAGNKRKYDNYNQFGPQLSLRNDGSWVPFMIPMDRFVEVDDDAGGDFDPATTVAFYLAYYGAASNSQGSNAFQLWFDDVRFIKHTFDQPWPNVCADVFSEHAFNMSAMGVNGGPNYNEHLSPNTSDVVVGNQSLMVADPGNAWPGTARFGFVPGASSSTVLALDSPAWYFDGWVKMDPIYNKSNFMMIEDLAGNYIRWWGVFDRISAGGWVHMYLPMSRLATDNDKSASFDWSQVKKVYMGYYCDNGGNNGATTLLDGWRLLPYADAKQYPVAWADAFSENHKDHFGVSAISEAIEGNMNGAELTVDTVNKVAGEQSVKFTKPSGWDASWWFYVGVYSGGSEAAWTLGSDWTLHASVMVQGADAGYTRYFELKDAAGNILRYDLGAQLTHDATEFTTLDIALSAFTDTSGGSFDYAHVTKALLRLNSGGTPTVWIDNLYFDAPQPNISLSASELLYTEGSGFEVDVTDGETSCSQELVIQNTGDAPLTFSGGHYTTPGLAIYGPNASDWVLDPAPDTTTPLEAGQSLTVTVRFVPAETLRTLGKQATLEITTDDPDQPVMTVALHGDAVPVELSEFAAQ